MIIAFISISVIYAILCGITWYLFYRLAKEISKETVRLLKAEINKLVDIEVEKRLSKVKEDEDTKIED